MTVIYQKWTLIRYLSIYIEFRVHIWYKTIKKGPFSGGYPLFFFIESYQKTVRYIAFIEPSLIDTR